MIGLLIALQAAAARPVNAVPPTPPAPATARQAPAPAPSARPRRRDGALPMPPVTPPGMRVRQQPPQPLETPPPAGRTPARLTPDDAAGRPSETRAGDTADALADPSRPPPAPQWRG